MISEVTKWKWWIPNIKIQHYGCRGLVGCHYNTRHINGKRINEPHSVLGVLMPFEANNTTHKQTTRVRGIGRYMNKYTWGNLLKLNCGDFDVTLALCRFMGCLSLQAQKTNGTDMSHAATRSYSVCTRLYYHGEKRYSGSNCGLSNTKKNVTLENRKTPLIPVQYKSRATHRGQTWASFSILKAEIKDILCSKAIRVAFRCCTAA